MSVLELTVLMPCLNEAKTVGICVDKARRTMESLGINGEVLIADNGSTDGSQDIAREHGARVIQVEQKGYGAALAGGIDAAKGEYVIMGDADDSYDFTLIGGFVEKLREGYDLVMGNRFRGGIAPKAMPFLHRYLGNPVLSFIGRLFFGSKTGDFYCGLRGFRRQAVLDLNIVSRGMEFALEMVVKSGLMNLKVCEIPTTLSPDGRGRAPHLKTWRDGWRSLRFFLIFSPRWLFLYPGLMMVIIGLIAGGVLTLQGVSRMNSLLLSMALMIMGAQSVFFAIAVRIFAASRGLLPPNKGLMRLGKIFPMEVGVFGGAGVVLLGLLGYVWATVYWIGHGMGAIPEETTRQLIIPSTLALLLGVQLVLNSFMISIVGFKKADSD